MDQKNNSSEEFNHENNNINTDNNLLTNAVLLNSLNSNFFNFINTFQNQNDNKQAGKVENNLDNCLFNESNNYEMLTTLINLSHLLSIQKQALEINKIVEKEKVQNTNPLFNITNNIYNNNQNYMTVPSKNTSYPQVKIMENIYNLTENNGSISSLKFNKSHNDNQHLISRSSSDILYSLETNNSGSLEKFIGKKRRKEFKINTDCPHIEKKHYAKVNNYIY